MQYESGVADLSDCKACLIQKSFKKHSFYVAAELNF